MKRRNFLGYSLLLLAGCSAATTSNSSSLSIMPAKIRFAVSDAKGLEDLQQEYEPFRVALAKALETEIEFFPVDNLLAAASALQSNQVDLVWAGPSEYVVIHARTNAAPVISIVRSDYYTVIAVRANSGIQSLTDLKGKTIDMWKLGSTGSYLGGTKLLMDAGLNPRSDFKIVNTEDHSLKLLKEGEVDAWARPFFRYKSVLEKEGFSEQNYPIIAQGKQLPGDIFILSSQLEPELATEIRARMLNHQDKLLQAILSVESLAARFEEAKLVSADDAAYDMVREVFRAIGQDKFF